LLWKSSTGLACIELFDTDDRFTEMTAPANKCSSDRYSVQNLKLLLKRIAHGAVVIELRSTTVVASDALSQTRGDIVTGLHPVNERMTEHVTSEVKIEQVLVHDGRATVAAMVVRVPRHKPLTSFKLGHLDKPLDCEKRYAHQGHSSNTALVFSIGQHVFAYPNMRYRMI